MDDVALTASKLATFVAVCLSTVLWPGIARAQTDCPFAEADAVADTLDAGGYFPLQVGNVWDYITKDSAFFESASRTEIIADTVIDGIKFFKLSLTSFNDEPEFSSNLVVRSSTMIFRTFVDDKLTAWTQDKGVEMLDAGFDRPFNSCFESADNPPGQMQIVISGSYGGNFSVQELETIRTISVPSIKSISTSYSGTAYAHGIGSIGGGAEVSVVTDLIFATIDGSSMGTKLDSLFNISVSIEEEPDPGETPNLEVYPNPISAQGTLVFRTPVADWIELEIYNALGQRVRRQPLGVMPGGEHHLPLDRRDLSSGIYFIRLIAGSGRSAVHSFVVR